MKTIDSPTAVVEGTQTERFQLDSPLKHSKLVKLSIHPFYTYYLHLNILLGTASMPVTFCCSYIQSDEQLIYKVGGGPERGGEGRGGRTGIKGLCLSSAHGPAYGTSS